MGINCLILTKALVNYGNFRENYFLSQITVPVQGVAIWITYSYHRVTTFQSMGTRGNRDKRFHPQLADFSYEFIIPGRMTSFILDI